MVAQKQLIHEIETLSADYFDEVFDFIGYLKTKPPVSLRVDTRMPPAKPGAKQKTFHYIGIDMSGFKFNRDEANER
jgi:hypothetical protein